MAIHFTCPHCQKSITARDDAGGRSGRCPGCMEPVTVPAREQEPAPELHDSGGSAWAPPADYVAGEGTGEAALGVGWGLARFGLNAFFAGALVGLVSLGFAAALGVALRWRPGPPPPAFGVAGIAMLLACALTLLGVILMCFAPSRARVRGFAWGAVASVALLVALSVQVRDRLDRGMGARDSKVLLASLAATLAFFSGWILLAYYTRGIGRHFGNEALRRSSGRWIRVVVFGFVGWIAFWFLLGVLVRRQDLLATVYTLSQVAFLICSGVLAIWYLRLVRGAAITVRNARFGLPISGTEEAGRELARQRVDEGSRREGLEWEDVDPESAGP